MPNNHSGSPAVEQSHPSSTGEVMTRASGQALSYRILIEQFFRAAEIDMILSAKTR